MGNSVTPTKSVDKIMIIEKNFTKYVVFSEDTIIGALNKANTNPSRLVFAVSESGVLEGVVTDGDIRRWLISTNHIDFDKPVSMVMNRDFQVANINEDSSVISEKFRKNIVAVPLVDDFQRLVAIALPVQKQYEIAGKPISESAPAFIIAEIGNNHNGSLELAKKLVDAAVESGADCAKFQLRDMKALYNNLGTDGDDASADLGSQYTLDILKRFQLSDKDMIKVFDYCNEKNIIPLCTPWDVSSLTKLKDYGMDAYKISSADFTNTELIEAVASTGKLMICSTGMATEAEINEGINFIKETGAPYVLLHCNSTYPAPFRDINLKYMQHLKEMSGGLIGYSGHERGINVAIASIALGAKIIEKHFTLDKSMEGNDHKVSLLPDEFANMVEGIRQVEEAMGSASERSLSQGEMMNRETLAKSLIASVYIPAGVEITDEMILIRSPGQGLQPNKKNELVGRINKVEKNVGDFFFPSDLEVVVVEATDYEFNRLWGVPVRYHDLQEMRVKSNMDLIEIHLSYKDMELDFRKYIEQPLDLGLVVHAPELFEGDHTLDLCSLDKTYRERSIKEMQRVIDLTRELQKYFNNNEPACIVTNVGGFSNDDHLSNTQVIELYQILKDSLQQLDTEGVEITPQSMPPFPWHFGGQQFHNLFMDAEGIVEFCSSTNMRICLDTSHSKLACNFMKKSFTEFTRKVAPYVAHMHIADAKGVDGEGLQIDDGDIDWASFMEIVDKLIPQASFIPEIWQGHKNGGQGAWKALQILSNYR